MDAIWWVVIVVAVALVILAVAARSYSQSRRRTALRDQFGPVVLRPELVAET